MNVTKTPKYVYVGQFESFWRLTLQEWSDVCRCGTLGMAYNLSKYRELQGRPIWLAKHADQTGYYRLRKDIIYYEPLDWSKEDWQEALDELDELKEYPQP